MPSPVRIQPNIPNGPNMGKKHIKNDPPIYRVYRIWPRGARGPGPQPRKICKKYAKSEITLYWRNIESCFLRLLGPFGILGWIRTGDGMHNAFIFFRFRRFSTFLVFLSEVVIFWKLCLFSNFAFSIVFGETLLPKCTY